MTTQMLLGPGISAPWKEQTIPKSSTYSSAIAIARLPSLNVEVKTIGVAGFFHLVVVRTVMKICFLT